VRRWWSVRGNIPTSVERGALVVMYGESWYGSLSYRYGWGAQIVAWAVVRCNSASIDRLGRRHFRVLNFQGALYTRSKPRIVYGIYPASVPWLFAGTIFVTIGRFGRNSPPLVWDRLVRGRSRRCFHWTCHGVVSQWHRPSCSARKFRRCSSRAASLIGNRI